MDRELATLRLLMRNAIDVTEARQKRLDELRPRLSRYYSRQQQVALVLVMLRELQDVVERDPDLWGKDKEESPF